MNVHTFALCFKGSGTAPQGDPPTAKVESRTQATMLTTAFKPGGVAADRIAKGDGNEAVFKSTVTMTGEGQFDESGTIDYGHGNTIAFSTLGRGHLGPSPMEGVQHGTVTWRIDRGTGAYQNATGYITSNFTLHSDGVVIDHQFAVIFVP